MNRRKAIQSLALITAGAALLPACNVEKIPVFENVPLEPSQYKLIDQLVQALLPRTDTPITTPETTTDFILTMFNDCRSPEDIEKYLSGLKAFEQVLKEQKKAAFKKMTADQKNTLLNEFFEAEAANEQIMYFIDNTRDMATWHFTSSEYYMKNLLDFEFIPGRYIGCSEI